MRPRIYADFNGYYQGKPTSWVELDTFGTLKDLHYFQVRLTEGLEIIAWDESGANDDGQNEDMEVVGICRYHGDLQRPHWCAHFPPGSLVYIPTRAESDSHPFICFKCRQPLPDSGRQEGKEFCPNCQLSIHYPWLAPESPEPESPNDKI